MNRWTILIPTLPQRAALFKSLHEMLSCLAARNESSDLRIEMITNNDPKPTIGAKRQWLLLRALERQADWVSFVDDDDMVSLDYVPRIAHALLQAQPDVVGFYGLAVDMTSESPADAHLFVHSARLDGWYQRDGLRIRTPNHLNPIRTTIAAQIGFNPDLASGEDLDFAKRLAEAHLVQKEAFIPHVLYTYRIHMFQRWQAEKGVIMDG